MINGVDFGFRGDMALQIGRTHYLLLQVLETGVFQRLGEKIGAIVLGWNFDQLEFAVLHAVDNFIPISGKIFGFRGLFSLRHSDRGCVVFPHQNNEILVGIEEGGWDGYVYAPDIEK